MEEAETAGLYDSREFSGTGPCLFMGSVDASEVVQGALGDCWLAAALSIVCLTYTHTNTHARAHTHVVVDSYSLSLTLSSLYRSRNSHSCCTHSLLLLTFELACAYSSKLNICTLLSICRFSCRSRAVIRQSDSRTLSLSVFALFTSYSIRLFHEGGWRFVMVDDYVPVSAAAGRPVFAHGKSTQELWVPILEKAFAKLYASAQ